MNPGEMLVLALFLAALNTSVVNFLMEPFRVKFPGVDFWWIMYIALVTGGLLGWASGLNLFPTLFANVLVGRALTSVLIGGGSKLIHDVMDQESVVYEIEA